jgi:hypothetical protein
MECWVLNFSIIDYPNGECSERSDPSTVDQSMCGPQAFRRKCVRDIFSLRIDKLCQQFHFFAIFLLQRPANSETFHHTTI